MSIDITLHFWRLDAPQPMVDHLSRVLDAGEIARADRFVHLRDRTAYRIGRGRLRELLGEWRGQDPASLQFDIGPQGKPSLSGGPHFNLSHSGGLACLAITQDVEIGADIEAYREVEDAVAERFFAPKEYAKLSVLPSVEWLAGFFRIWTRKEAVVKAIGEGLSIPLDAFDVTVDPKAPPLMTRLDPTRGRVEDWSLVHLAMGEAMVGALAVRAAGQAIRVQVRECPPDLRCHWSV